MFISIQNRRIERRLAGLELAITEEGVTYRSVAGTFPAPWSAVHRMAVHRMAVYGRLAWYGLGGFGPGSDFLLVQVRDWAGPVTILTLRTATLRMPLDDTNLDALAIARAVSQLSHGRITPDLQAALNSQAGCESPRVSARSGAVTLAARAGSGLGWAPLPRSNLYSKNFFYQLP